MSEPSLRRAARALVPVGAVALVFGGVAIAAAATDSGVDTPHDLAERGLVDDGSPSTTGAPTAAVDAARTEAFDLVNLPDGATQTFTAGAAGTVTIGRTGSTLTVVAVGANPGWVTEIEQQSGTEVEVVFRNGTARIDLEAEFEDGAVRVRVRERNDAVDDDVTAPTTPTTPTAPTAPTTPTTPTTRIDNSGPGSINSGPGSVNSGRDGDDDDDDGPDHEVGDDSGSGGSGSGSSGSGSSGSGHSGPG